MQNGFKSCCFTGYRPSKFPFPLSGENSEYIRFENKLIDAIFSLPSENCYTFYTGCVMGFDLIAAEIVLMLKRSPKVNYSAELICAVPFTEQAASFTPEWKERYNNVIACADEVVLISDRYFDGCYQRRNEFMVNNSDIVLTWYDGKSGGTGNTLKYADKRGKRIVNLAGYGVHEYFPAEGYEIIEGY